MVEVRLGFVTGVKSIINAMKAAIRDAKKNFFLVIKYVYPQLSEFMLLNFDARITPTGVSISVSNIPSLSFYHRLYFQMHDLLRFILRNEFKKQGLDLK